MRKRYKRIYPENWEERILNNYCPVCNTHRADWRLKRHTDWKTCSPKHTVEFWKKVQVFDWREIRTQAFKRDNYKCKKCKITFPKKELEADHILAIALGGEEFDINNVQTLCKPCHKHKTKRDIFKIRLKAWKEKRKNRRDSPEAN